MQILIHLLRAQNYN